ncbi:unnamed protein product, partial [Acanthocheilonema viteae]
MVYKKVVEIGRVVFVAKGDGGGKLATIVDVVDGNRALIDGPTTGVRRSVRNFKDLHLTKFHIPLRHGMRTKNVKKAFDEAKISEKWAETLWAQKLAKKAILDHYMQKVIDNQPSFGGFLKQAILSVDTVSME